MSLAPLATVDDVAARLGRTLTDADETRVEALLADVSGTVRAYTGQQFVEVSGDTVTLRPHAATDAVAGTWTWERNIVGGFIVKLPQRPVTAVNSVADSDGNPVGYDWPGLDDVWVSTARPVVVDYDHGTDEVPADVIAVVCQIVGRAFGAPAEDAGLIGETIGGYSYQRGGAAGAGPAGMLPDERRVLDRYRRGVTPARML